MQVQAGAGVPSRIRAALLLGASLVTSACALDQMGAIASSVHRADGAWVVDVYSLGGYVRSRADDPGLQLGFGRRSYVFDLRDDQELVTGWHFFSVDLLDRQAVATDSWTVGLEMGLARDDLSANAGLIATTRMARLDASDSVAYALSYRPSQPQATRFAYLTYLTN